MLYTRVRRVARKFVGNTAFTWITKRVQAGMGFLRASILHAHSFSSCQF